MIDYTVKHEHSHKNDKNPQNSSGQVLLPMGYEENSGFRAFFSLAFSERLWTMDLGWRMLRDWSWRVLEGSQLHSGERPIIRDGSQRLPREPMSEVLP